MWKIIGSIEISKLIDSIETMLFISKMKFADPTVLRSNLIKKFKCCNVCSCFMFFVNRDVVFESISNFLNSEKSYLISIVKLKTYETNAINEISFMTVIRCLRVTLTRFLMIRSNSVASTVPIEMLKISLTSSFDKAADTLKISFFDVSIIKFLKKWATFFSFWSFS